ncbi:AlbA family DNA-binding domain-containing protein [Streptomyces phaeolivaceus]|nr:ATP-binding protein [Streptomyces phaeolivaceus]
MVALRSRRLEGLFGARLDAVSHAQVAALKTNAVSESYDLEFKGELYGGNDKAKRDLAGDVAALANTAGGVLLLGVAEDDQARAAELPGVALSDSEVLRYRNTSRCPQTRHRGAGTARPRASQPGSASTAVTAAPSTSWPPTR